VEQVRRGKDRVLGWFVGEVMKATHGQGNPGLVAKLFKARIQQTPRAD